MKLLHRIVYALYSAYCIITFIIMILVLVPAYAAVHFFNDKTRTLAAYRANRVISGLWFAACGYSLKIEGAEKIDPSKTYMFVCNHCNILDMPITGYFLQHYYKSLAKQDLRRIPFMGFLFSAACVFVDRSSNESRRKSTQVIMDKLKNGVSFLIFPEGTRNSSDEPLKSFHRGAFMTAIMAQVPVLPLVYLDHRALQPVSTFSFKPGAIRVKVFDPIDTAEMTTADVDNLKNRVYHLLEETIEKEDKKFK